MWIDILDDGGWINLDNVKVAGATDITGSGGWLITLDGVPINSAYFASKSDAMTAAQELVHGVSLSDVTL